MAGLLLLGVFSPIILKVKWLSVLSGVFQIQPLSALFRSWGVKANQNQFAGHGALFIKAVHLSSPSGYYILSFCIFIAINLCSNLAQGFSWTD